MTAAIRLNPVFRPIATQTPVMARLAENQTFEERLAAGNHRYSVGTETARFRATSRGGIPPASNCLADLFCLSSSFAGDPQSVRVSLQHQVPLAFARRLAHAPFVRRPVVSCKNTRYSSNS